MIRKLVTFMIIAAMAAGPALAEEAQAPKESGLASWLKGLQKRIETVTTRKPLPLSTGVAGVRGARQEDAAKLYWKGKAAEEPVTEEELAEFKAALELAGKGDQAAAIKELDAFMQKHPDSALIPDAKKTLDLVKAGGGIENSTRRRGDEGTRRQGPRERHGKRQRQRHITGL